ncbi:kinase-like protein [Auricularia subglabra TFB-10046 SS5]|nr:kinase-like protein [Auricularia subglabra TFB-10046 SS5]
MDPKVISRRFRREIRVWSTLKHRYILPIYGVHISSNDELPALVSPWCTRGNLNDYIKGRRRGNDPMIDLCLDKLQEVLSAISYLHGQNPPIIHGDLKGNNILVAMDGRIQLADFGLSLIQAEHGSLMSTDPAGKGTLPFMSCELLEHESPTVHSDMWAVSCVLVEMVSGLPPYHDKPNNKAKILAIMSGEFPKRPKELSEELWALVTTNWNRNPIDRLSADRMLSRLVTSRDDPLWRSS